MTFNELLETRAEKDGDKPFVFFRDRILNFGALNKNVNKAANALRMLGVQRGDHVCLFLPNCLEFLYLWLGLAKIGGVMIPLNAHLRGEGLKYIINHCDASLIVVDEALYDAYAFVERDLLKIKKRLWSGSNAAVPADFLSFQALMEASEEVDPPAAAIHDGDPLGIIYTSGTTGPPKGAMISQFNYLNSGKVWADHLIKCRPEDIFYTCLPLFHANAQMFTTMGSLQSARPFVLRERFSASGFFDDVRRVGATVINYVGGMLTILMSQPQRADDADNPVRIAFGGAAPREIWADFERRFRLTIVEGFGLTETGGVATCNPPDAIKLGSVGKPTPFCDVAIWDGNMREVPLGETGEIVVSPKVDHAMFLGYYKQPDKTAEAWEGGWFHTGDRGYKDQDGYFYYVDRIKDCIRRRGENISSYEIEKVLNAHPKVLESAAVGVPSDVGEDDVKVYIALKPNQDISPEELIAYCEERMAYFMVPRYIELVDQFPKTATHRIQKFELRKVGVGNSWDREQAGYRLKRI